MGHRANFVVIRDGQALAYFDNWAALGCVHGLEQGPELALKNLEETEPTTELLDWAFCEGGYLLDFDQELVIVFGEILDEDYFADDVDDEPDAEEDEFSEDDADNNERAEALEFLQSLVPHWAGWTLCWDQRGADAFAAHLAERQITSISCEPASHSADALQIEIQA